MSTELYEEVSRKADLVNETNDCSVRAVAIATGHDYDVVRKAFYGYGRKHRGCGNDSHPWRYFRKHGFTHSNVTEKYPKAKTIRTAVRHLPKDGIFLVRVYAHVLCIRDGEVHDWTVGRLKRVRWIHRVLPPCDSSS